MRPSLFESGQTLVLIAAIAAAAAGIFYSAAHSMAEDSRQERDAVYVSLTATPHIPVARPVVSQAVETSVPSAVASEDSALACAALEDNPAACTQASEVY